MLNVQVQLENEEAARYEKLSKKGVTHKSIYIRGLTVVEKDFEKGEGSDNV